MIIVPQINIKTLLRMGRDCQMMVICRRFSEISRDASLKTSCNHEYTLCHKNASTSHLKINKTHRNDGRTTRWARWGRWACPRDKHDLDDEHPEIYATIKNTSLH